MAQHHSNPARHRLIDRLKWSLTAVSAATTSAVVMVLEF